MTSLLYLLETACEEEDNSYSGCLRQQSSPGILAFCMLLSEVLRFSFMFAISSLSFNNTTFSVFIEGKG